MSGEMWIALLSFAGTVVGAALGCIASAKLTQYRLAQLEKKVEKHNSVYIGGTDARGGARYLGLEREIER